MANSAGVPVPLPYIWERPYPFNNDGTNNQGSRTRMPHPNDNQLKLLADIFPQLTRPATNFTQFSAVPLVLNMFNNRSNAVRSNGSWVYTYHKLIDPKVIEENLDFDEGVQQDLRTPWSSVVNYPNRRKPMRLPRYRFVAFIYQHKYMGRDNSITDRRRFIFSLVYWDRERNEMFWHDTGLNPSEQQQRWADVQNWWRSVRNNQMPPGQGPRIQLFGRNVSGTTPNYANTFRRFKGTPKRQNAIANCHDEYLHVLDAAHTNPGAPRAHGYWSMSITPVMCWIMWLAIHTNGDAAGEQPILDERIPWLSTGLHRQTMPSLIILIYQVLYSHRARRRALDAAMKDRRACYQKFGITDNMTLNKIVRELKKTSQDDTRLDEPEFDGLTRSFPYNIL
ncbi:hypothetical protein Hte_009636 [Hypoxylon texense]